MSDPRDEEFLGLLKQCCDTDDPIDVPPSRINESPLPDPENWTWSAKDQRFWEEVDGGLCGFYNHWRGRRYGSDLQEQFPYTLSLGGEGVQLPVEPDGTTDNNIVVTEGYHKMYYRILDFRKPGRPNRGVVLTGQPGTGASVSLISHHPTTHWCTLCPGKTFFLNFLLARLISAKQVVLLFSGSRLRLFYNGKVYERDQPRFIGLPMHKQGRKWPIWALVNADALTGAPLIDNEDAVWPIQASPPNPKRWKVWTKQRGAAIVGMPLWSKEELMEGYVLATFSHLSHLCRLIEVPHCSSSLQFTP